MAMGKWFILLFLFLASRGLAECGGPCQLEDGEYFVALPDTDGPHPVVLFLHGYAVTGEQAVAGKLATGFRDLGYAVVVPSGQVDLLQGSSLDWNVDDGVDWVRDDIVFVQEVLADAVDRFDLDAKRVLVAGYSRGGSMVWDLACKVPGLALGFAAVSGTFWGDMPKACAGPVHLHHAHGFRDRTLPLEGGSMEWFGSTFHRVDVYEALANMRDVNGCGQVASSTDTSGHFWIKRWASCKSGSVTLAISPGGHGRDGQWPALVAAWFEDLRNE